MAFALVNSAMGFAPTAAPQLSTHAVQCSRASAPSMETVADLKVLAEKCNPVVGYYNPTPLAEMEFWGQSNEATIGFLRHAEIKHGRVAMAAFVGFVLQSNGVHFPWALSFDGTTFGDISAAGGPAAQWDALPTNSKCQIITAIGFFEWWGENKYALGLSDEKHYMRGGKPGFYPSLKKGIPHPVPLDLWDPFGFTTKMTAERKEQALVAEINNGRLAMIGIMGFMAASKGLIVPGLDSVGVAPYTGQVMAPLTAADKLPFVPEMASIAWPF